MDLNHEGYWCQRVGQPMTVIHQWLPLVCAMYLYGRCAWELLSPSAGKQQLHGCENYCFQEKTLPSKSVKNYSMGLRTAQLFLSGFSVIAEERLFSSFCLIFFSFVSLIQQLALDVFTKVFCDCILFSCWLLCAPGAIFVSCCFQSCLSHSLKSFFLSISLNKERAVMQENVNDKNLV